jgi:hypothetical protein
MLPEQRRPDLQMPILDLREPPIHVLLRGIGLRLREHAIEEGGVGLVLPVMLERVEIGSTARSAGCGGGGHGEEYMKIGYPDTRIPGCPVPGAAVTGLRASGPPGLRASALPRFPALGKPFPRPTVSEWVTDPTVSEDHP